MVYAFLIHTLVPGTCRVLYSTVFSEDGDPTDRISPNLEKYEQHGNPSISSVSLTIDGDSRAHRKKWLLHIAQTIQSEYTFRSKGSRLSYEQELLTLQTEGTLPEFELGFFRTAPLIDGADLTPTLSSRSEVGGGGGPLSGGRHSRPDKVVVWLAALNCGFALVCEKIESRIAAENVLKTMIRYLHEHVRVLTQPSEAILKADQVALVVRQFLPGGALLPLNHRLIRQFEKEVDSGLKQQ